MEECKEDMALLLGKGVAGVSDTVMRWLNVLRNG